MSEHEKIQFAYTSKEIVSIAVNKTPYFFLPFTPEIMNDRMEQMKNAGSNSDQILKKCTTVDVHSRGYGIPIVHLIHFDHPLVQEWGEDRTRVALYTAVQNKIAELKASVLDCKINKPEIDPNEVFGPGWELGYFETFANLLEEEATPSQGIRNR